MASSSGKWLSALLILIIATQRPRVGDDPPLDIRLLYNLGAVVILDIIRGDQSVPHIVLIYYTTQQSTTYIYHFPLIYVVRNIFREKRCLR